MKAAVLCLGEWSLGSWVLVLGYATRTPHAHGLLFCVDVSMFGGFAYCRVVSGAVHRFALGGPDPHAMHMCKQPFVSPRVVLV